MVANNGNYASTTPGSSMCEDIMQCLFLLTFSVMHSDTLSLNRIWF